MAKITEELVRKRAEHNEGAIGSLEEISLHMLHISRLEHLDHWCRDLRILLLNNNIISKIENLSRMKKLEYLNLSLNVIERVENLEGCESLERLDLTLNFIGELTSVASLKENYNLRQMILTGNPCAQFDGYREYVIITLPQLTELDSKEIIRSERIIAAQKLENGLEKSILEQQQKYQEFREQQKLRAPQSLEEKLQDEKYGDLSVSEKIKEIWAESSEHSPEVRHLMAEMSLRQQEETDSKPVQVEKPRRRLYTDEGRPLNVNEAQLDFSMTEDEEGHCIVLKIPLNRSLDTSDLGTDIHPDHIRVTVRGRVFQLTLLEEIRPDAAKAERSLATGCLVIRMPLVREHVIIPNKDVKSLPAMKKTQIKGPSNRELLEIGAPDSDLDFSRIVRYEDELAQKFFEDDPDVPPLEEAD